MRILDLFCGAGGASMGYHRAFPDAEIVGIDIAPQPHYPFTFMQADAIASLANRAFTRTFDLIHASPPCQDHSALKSMHEPHGTGWLLAATVAALRERGLPWVVENVPGSDEAMGGSFVTLCGSSFGLGVRRHRNFASSFLVLAPPCRHNEQGQPVGVYGHGGGASRARGWKGTLTESSAAMGIDWMTAAELAQAIPPAYTEYIGNQFAATLEAAA